MMMMPNDPEQGDQHGASCPISDRRSDRRENDPRQARFDAVFALARAAGAYDPDTGAHVLRIRSLVAMLAWELGLQPDDAEALGVDAMLHDVGKMRIESAILQKSGALTEDERKAMQQHTIEGERMLADQPTMRRAARIARSHHEHFDGSGFPDGLTGKGIPFEARVTAVADVLDALVSERPYKHAWSFEDALAELRRLSGTHLDPEVLRALDVCHDQGLVHVLYEAE